jgi:Bacterial aa3 type cytochrome c oxidase subunit IV
MAAEKSNIPANEQDLPAHLRNYEAFTKLVKFTALAAFLIALTVMFLISN